MLRDMQWEGAMSGETIPMGAGSAKALRLPQFGPQCGSQSG